MARIQESDGLRPAGWSFALAAALALIASCRHPGLPRVASETQLLGAGVTLSIDPPRPARSAISKPGVVPLWVTVANHGPSALQIRYRDFALSDDVMTDDALLPSELGLAPGTGALLREGALASGASVSGLLYFRLPPRHPSSLRVDLETADAQTTISRSYVKLRFD
jgi:hypothetical protein